MAAWAVAANGERDVAEGAAQERYRPRSTRDRTDWHGRGHPHAKLHARLGSADLILANEGGTTPSGFRSMGFQMPQREKKKTGGREEQPKIRTDS